MVAVTHTDIQVLQKKKLFPFGTAVNAQKYNHNVAGGKYQAFIHNHFNWAVPENALKWYAIEPSKVRMRQYSYIRQVKCNGWYAIEPSKVR